MTTLHPMPDGVVLMAIDIAKFRNKVLIEVPGAKLRRRMTVLNTREEHDRLVAMLLDLGRPVACAFEATGNYHRPIAWRLTRNKGRGTAQLTSLFVRIVPRMDHD